MADLPSVDDLYRSMGRMMVRLLARCPGAESVIAPQAVLACSGLDHIFLNCGLVFGESTSSAAEQGAVAEAWLREFVGTVRAREVGGYVCLSEGVQAALEPVARELGLEPMAGVPLMSRPAGAAGAAGPAPAGRCAAELVATEVGLSEFLAVNEAAFGLPIDLYAQLVTPELLHSPGLSMYLCRLDDAAVSCVSAVDDDGVVGISGVATLPEAQGRGIGGRLVGHVIDAYAGRARAFCLSASEEGRGLYERWGFSVVDNAAAWAIEPPPRRHVVHRGP